MNITDGKPVATHKALGIVVKSDTVVKELSYITL